MEIFVKTSEEDAGGFIEGAYPVSETNNTFRLNDSLSVTLSQIVHVIE